MARVGAVTSPLISQREERVWIKVRRCQAFVRGGKLSAIRRSDSKVVQPLVLTKGIHHVVLLCDKCCEQNCSFYHLEHLLTQCGGDEKDSTCRDIGANCYLDCSNCFLHVVHMWKKTSMASLMWFNSVERLCLYERGKVWVQNCLCEICQCHGCWRPKTKTKITHHGDHWKKLKTLILSEPVKGTPIRIN